MTEDEKTRKVVVVKDGEALPGYVPGVEVYGIARPKGKRLNEAYLDLDVKVDAAKLVNVIDVRLGRSSDDLMGRKRLAKVTSARARRKAV